MLAPGDISHHAPMCIMVDGDGSCAIDREGHTQMDRGTLVLPHKDPHWLLAGTLRAEPKFVCRYTCICRTKPTGWQLPPDCVNIFLGRLIGMASLYLTVTRR